MSNPRTSESLVFAERNNRLLSWLTAPPWSVVTRLLEAGEPDHVVESITGHLSRRMLEHHSHIRLTAKKAALDRLNEPRKVRK
jgi:hypothetical protein